MTRTTKKATTVATKATTKAIKKDEISPDTISTNKKKPVEPKVVKSAKAKKAELKKDQDDTNKTLDLCLLMDCTSSMSSWIARSKDTLKEIIDQIKSGNKGLKIRVAFVGYRDIKDTERFTIQEFTDDVDKVKNFISKTKADGGADMPEDVQGGLNKALNLNWMSDSIKVAFLICDAPGHGNDINGFNGFLGDDYEKGSPDGFKIQDQMQSFAQKEIHFTIVKVNDSCDAMIKVMQDNYNGADRKLGVSDLAHAVQTKSYAEVTKDFVNAASFMLCTAIGGQKIAAARKDAPLWDCKQLDVGQYLSQTAYLTVQDIQSNRITVVNSFGQQMHVSRDILEKMNSANHFKHHVFMNMTQLAELLESVGDTVFSVRFHKKPNEEQVQKKLQETKVADIKNAANLSKLVKELTQGEICEMVCHLVKAESKLGRSTVIDLQTTNANKFRMIDHRTIEYIIVNNTKYELKRGSKKVENEEENKKDEPKWDFSQLTVGNIFSGTNYYSTVEIKADQVMCKSEGNIIAISKDILEYEMYSASVYQREEKVSLTEMAEIMESANTSCFTVCFTTKIDEDEVKRKLSNCTQDQLKEGKQLTKEILSGKESVLVCRLSSSEGKLGRSLVVDLKSKGFRQVDHRTLKWLINKNVKYTLKK